MSSFTEKYSWILGPPFILGASPRKGACRPAGEWLWGVSLGGAGLGEVACVSGGDGVVVLIGGGKGVKRALVAFLRAKSLASLHKFQSLEEFFRAFAQ